jgi:hypothetical protein
MAKAPHCRGCLADEPRPSPDDDNLRQWLAALLTLCVYCTQARDERAWIAAVVWVVLPDERPSARFVRLAFFHLPDCAIMVICCQPEADDPVRPR